LGNGELAPLRFIDKPHHYQPSQPDTCYQNGKLPPLSYSPQPAQKST